MHIRMDRDPLILSPSVAQELNISRFSMIEIYLCGALHIAPPPFPLGISMGSSSAVAEPVQILFLAANPRHTRPLELDREVRHI